MWELLTRPPCECQDPECWACSGQCQRFAVSWQPDFDYGLRLCWECRDDRRRVRFRPPARQAEAEPEFDEDEFLEDDYIEEEDEGYFDEDDEYDCDDELAALLLILMPDL